MKRQSRKQRLMAEINITPFTDVILVLLVIFMITTPLLSQTPGRQIKVNLPKAKNAALALPHDEVVSITLSSEGPMYLDGEIITLKEMEEKLAAAKMESPGIGVALMVDRLVAFKNVVRVLDVLNNLGIERLRIGAEEEK
jgi:biopolymer transport protein ExbD